MFCLFLSGRKERREQWYMVTPKAMIEADMMAFNTEEEEEERSSLEKLQLKKNG